MSVHHEGMYVSAVAEARGVTRDAIYKILYRAYRNLRAAGITPPDRKRAGLEQKGNAQVRTVDPFTLGEMTEG